MIFVLIHGLFIYNIICFNCLCGFGTRGLDAVIGYLLPSDSQSCFRPKNPVASFMLLTCLLPYLSNLSLVYFLHV